VIGYGAAVILGRRELTEALNNLPARVVKRIMDEWVIRQAREVAAIARRTAPRDRNPNRRKPDSARLWRSIKASRVKNLKRFPGAISRAVTTGGSRKDRVQQTLLRQAARARKGNARRARSPVQTVLAPRARHFHWNILGTTMRVQRTTGRSTGAHRKTSPFFSNAIARVTASAGGEVGAQLRDAYERGIQQEIKRLERKYR
jgi:hypothetical protein